MIAVALRESSRRRPEWTAASLAACSWVVVAVTGLYVGGHGGHEHHHHLVAVWPPSILAWTTMAVAMMLPAALPAVRSIALGSLWYRRQRAVAVFVGTYLLVWVAFGFVVVKAAADVAQLDTGATTVLPLALVVAATWELTSHKRRALRACHMIVPPPPRGWRADVGCARAGLTYGRRCVLSCWALMLPMAVGGHESLPLMVLLALIVAAQKLLVRGPDLGIPASATLFSAGAIVMLA